MKGLALVIGGNGFIGSSLTIRLRQEGWQVRVLDHSAPRGDVDWHGVDYRKSSHSEIEELGLAMKNVDVVYHLASTTIPSTSNLDPRRDVAENLVGALNVINAMETHDVRRIVFFSSGGTVYGNPAATPVDETSSLDPVCSYGVVKVAIEKYLAMYRHLGRIDPLIIRPSNPYGPRQSISGQQGAIAVFLGKALRKEPVEIWGDGEVVRDYIYIDDLLDLVIHANEVGYSGILNAGTGTAHTLNDVCRIIKRATGELHSVIYKQGRPFDVRRLVLDMSKAREVLHWEPRVSLENGIDKTWRYLSKHNTEKENEA